MKTSIRQVLGLFLLALLLVKVCLMPMIYLDFELRRDYIASTLCENRLKPKLQCNGKCYLAKRIAAAQKEQEKQTEQNFLTKAFTPVVEPSSLFDSNFFENSLEYTSEKSAVYAYSELSKFSQFTSGIFHPPLS